jgi:hypothetical protein
MRVVSGCGCAIFFDMQSKSLSVQDYLASLPEDRRQAISAVREVILKNLDRDYEEGMTYGMIGYYVPHSVYPAGYHCNPKQPLCFANLGSQKNYMSLHLMCVYECEGGGPASELARWFREAWARTGKKLDMGRACIRFRKAEDLALDVIAEAIRRMPAKAYIEFCEASLRNSKERAEARKKPAPAGKATAAKTRRSGARPVPPV